MFALVFLPNPSFESIFAQKQICRSFLPLQLLFWPNFKFLYGILSFNWSMSGQISVKTITVLHSSSLCRRPYRDDRRRLHASHAPAILAIRAASPLSARELWRLLVLISSPSSRPRQAKPEHERAATAAGADSDHPSPSRLDPVRPNLHRRTPHPRRPSPSPITPLPCRIGLPDRGPPLPSAPELRPSRRRPLSDLLPLKSSRW